MYIAEVHVHDLVCETADTLEDILARFVARADTIGHAVGGGVDLGEQTVKGVEVVEYLRHAIEGGHGRVVAVHGEFDVGAFRDWSSLAKYVQGAFP